MRKGSCWTVVALTLALALAVGASTSAASANAASRSGDAEMRQLDRQLQRDFNAANDRGRGGPRPHASTPACVVLFAVCARVVIAVGTGIAGKIAARGSSKVKTVAKEAAKKNHVSFTKVRNNMQRYANEAKALKRSKAYRKGLWRKVARRFKNNLGTAIKGCASGFAGVLIAGGSIRTGIYACLAGFAIGIATPTSKAGDPSQRRGAYGKPGPNPRTPALATIG